MNSKLVRNYSVFIIFAILLITYIITLLNVGSNRIITLLGVENTYIVIFLLAIFGGVSSLTSTSFYAFFVTLVAGDVNLVLIIALASIGLTIGDSLFYFFGVKGRDVANESRYQRHIRRVESFIEKRNKWSVFIGITLYASLPLPLPKDIICIASGIVKYNITILLSALAIGNLIHLILIATLLIVFNIRLI